MDYWIIRNNQQVGPMTVNEVRNAGITPDTPVWHNGLTDWLPAGKLPELMPLFDETLSTSTEQTVVVEKTVSPTVQETVQPVATETTGTAAAAATTGNVRFVVVDDENECPPSYLAWAIVVTILFFLPAGIPAIIFATKVNPLYKKGELKKARKMSERAALWTIISFVLGLIFIPFSIVFEMF